MTKEKDQTQQEPTPEAPPAEEINRGPENTAYQTVLIEKWFDVSLDTDRQLLTLSTAAIGLLATLLTSKGVSSITQLFLIVFAGLLFFAVIGILLLVFQQNKAVLKSAIAMETADESALEMLDKAARTCFFSGVCLLSIFAVSIAIDELEKSNEKKVIEKYEQKRSSDIGKPYEYAKGGAASGGDLRQCAWNYGLAETSRICSATADHKPN